MISEKVSSIDEASTRRLSRDTTNESLNSTEHMRNSYVNNLSPSSTASSSTIEAPPYRSLLCRAENTDRLYPRRRLRLDRIFDRSHRFYRNYAIAMTKIHFQMQREIYHLRQRTRRLEKILEQERQYGRPIIRIPRLTKDDLSAASADENANRTENNQITEPQSLEVSIDRSQSMDSRNEYIETFVSSPVSDSPYCSMCKRTYANKKRYEHHLQKYHSKPIDSNGNENVSDSNHYDNESTEHFAINPWDLGEGRLRPRFIARIPTPPRHKAKCPHCQKLYNASYMKTHIANKHEREETLLVTDASENSENQPEPIAHESDQIFNALMMEVPSNLTVVPMEPEDSPIVFPPRENEIQIIFATTCIERHQTEMIDNFVRKFSKEVRLVSTINIHTTHLIVNDEKQTLRSPLSLKFLQAVANNCFCLSYNWILECLRYDRIIDIDGHEIEGVNTNDSIIGGPKRSRLIEKRHSLFEEYCFIVKANENNEAKISKQCIKELLTNCGGKIIESVTPNLLKSSKILVICDRSYIIEQRANVDVCRGVGVGFVPLLWLVESILDYNPRKIQNYQELLF